MDTKPDPQSDGHDTQQGHSTIPDTVEVFAMQSCPNSESDMPRIKQEALTPPYLGWGNSTYPLSDPINKRDTLSSQDSKQLDEFNNEKSSCVEATEHDKSIKQLAISENLRSTSDIRCKNENKMLLGSPSTKMECNEVNKREYDLPNLQITSGNELISSHAVNHLNIIDNIAKDVQDVEDADPVKQRRKKSGPGQKGSKTVKKMFIKRHKALKAPQESASQDLVEGHTPAKRRKTLDTKIDGSSSIEDGGIMHQLINHNAIAASKGHASQEKPAQFMASTEKIQFDNLLKNCPESISSRMARGELKGLREAVRKFSSHNIKAADGKWTLEGMTTPLYGYQIIGVAWMIDRELSLDEPNGPFGGICADAMGLGKTIEAIATMVSNPPENCVPLDKRSTLIVVPASIKLQWFSEIERHAKSAFPRIMSYKASENTQMIRITDCDIVITTWKELSRSCPFPDKHTYNQLQAKFRKQKGNPEDDESTTIEEWIENSHEGRGQLHEIDWYRIILDESHHIKNHLCRQSLAARTLKGKYRWTLSGTPIMNRLEEFYPYFRFLRDLSSAPSYRLFKSKFCNQKNTTSKHPIDTILAKYMLRRTMGHMFLGRPIVDLPTPTEHNMLIEFSPEEKILYRAFEDRLRELLNEILERKDERKNLTRLYVQLTRLRQYTAHPLLIEHQMKIAFEVDHLKEIQKNILALPSPNIILHDRITVWMKLKKPGEVGLKALLHAEDVQLCEKCGDSAKDPVMINIKNCQHIFCNSCIEEELKDQNSNGIDQSTCPECQKVFDPESSLKPLVPEKCDPGASTTTKKGRDALQHHPRTPGSDWLRDSDMGQVPLFQSAKIKALMDQIMNWLKDAPNDKIIVFTQWRGFAVIIGRSLEDKKIPFVYYTGGQAAAKRSMAVCKFESESSIKVMVAGLKCGGVGLNLACANRAINVDPWWNTCIEQQAFGRVYRLPQAKETHFARFMVKNSVDSRIARLQKKKEGVVDPRMKRKITHEEMAELFGRVTIDEKGNMRIDRDYSDKGDSGDEKSESDSGSDDDYID